MPIRVLFVGRYDITPHNIRPEAEMIIGLAERDFEVGVMTKADCDYARRMTAAGIRIHDFVPARKFSITAIRRIHEVLVGGHYDIIHLFNNKAIVAGVMAAVGLPVKVVTYRGQTGNISRYDPVCYLTHLSPRVDRIVCVAEAVRQSLLPEVRDPAIPVTIYKGHDLAWYRDVEPVDRTSLGIPGDAFLVGCVANNRPRKGVPVLIEASNAIPLKHNVHFALIGTGMDSEEITRQIRVSSHRDRFHVLGFRDDVLKVIAACDATVLPSTKREGLPKTVIESMALSVPPVVTATGGSPELVDERSGIVVPPNDPGAVAVALGRLASNREAARAMGKAARQRLAERFRLEDSINAHAALYESLSPGIRESCSVNSPGREQ